MSLSGFRPSALHVKKLLFPTMYRTYKSMQPFRKYTAWKLEHSAIAMTCTVIVVKSVDMHRFRNFFHDCLLNIYTNNIAAGSC